MIRKLVGAFLIAVIGFGLLPVVGTVTEIPDYESETINGNLSTSGETFDLQHTWEYGEIEENIFITHEDEPIVEYGYILDSDDWDRTFNNDDETIDLIDLFDGGTFQITLTNPNELEVTLTSASSVLEEGDDYTITLEREYEPTTTDQLVSIIPFLYALIIVGGVVVYIKFTD